MISAAMKMFELTQLNTYVITGGEIVYHHEKVSVPSFIRGVDEAYIVGISHRMDVSDQLYSHTNPWGLAYLGYSFQKEDEKHIVMIGPYFELTPNLYNLSTRYSLSANERTQLSNFLEKIKILTPEQVSSYKAVLQQFKSFQQAEMTSIIIEVDEEIQSRQIEKADGAENAELVEERYRIEQNFMHAVERGDKQAALKLISSDNMLFSFSERFTNQPLRRLKNIAVILNTILRIAARNGHVPAILIHQISEKFAYEIENGENVAAIQQIQDRMIGEYCDLVKAASLKKYSYMTQRAIEHIMSHYDQQINTQELAAHCHTHPGNLSRKFKSETGMTITEYQQNLRTTQAKQLLKTENLPIDEIAWMVGYGDASYFGRVFKKHTGHAPSDFRRNAEE